MISFIHTGGSGVASYRYRAKIPAEQIGAKLNDLDADVLVFSKPSIYEMAIVRQSKKDGKKIVADFCDSHFDELHYKQMLNLADAVTCPTAEMASYLRDSFDREAHVVPDPYEFPIVAPHCRGTNLLWYGHQSNFKSLQSVIRELDDFPLMIVSNHPCAMPWSIEEMVKQFAAADIVVIPETAPYKSPNRAIEAVRQGCFVVAHPHPGLEGMPVMQTRDLKSGIEWVRDHLDDANAMTAAAQAWTEKHSPENVGKQWKKVLEAL